MKRAYIAPAPPTNNILEVSSNDNKASTASKMICTKLKNMYPGLNYDTIIEMDHRIKEAQIMSMPVIQYNKDSRAGKQYLRLAKEILDRA